MKVATHRFNGEEINLHSDTSANPHPAVKVKLGRLPDGGTQEQRDAAYKRMEEEFWNMLAPELAHARGYSGVFAEGRSNGWVVPFYQTTHAGVKEFGGTKKPHPGQGGDHGQPTYPDVSKIGERNRFLAFQRDIQKLLATAGKVFLQYMKEEDEEEAKLEKYRQAAKRIHVSEGSVEIDEGATVSISDDGGAYVQAWVWVDDDDVEAA